MHRLHLAYCVIGIAALAACSDDSTSPDDIFGTYTLVSANGAPVPALVLDTVVIGTSLRITLNSGSVVVNENGTWSSTVNQTITTNGSPVTTNEPGSGTWARSGNSITFTEPGTPPVTHTGTVNGSEMTFTLLIESVNKTITLLIRKT